MYEHASQLIAPSGMTDEEAEKLLSSVGFSQWEVAWQRLQSLPVDEASREELSACLPMLLIALSETAVPDGSLVNFERYAHSVSDRYELFHYLATNPRAVEILVKLFVGSQFLTEILLRNPTYLQKLTKHKRLAEFKSQQQFYIEAMAAAAEVPTILEKMDALRRYQHWELLRIGACDSFGLMDLKTVTVQLSLLADSLVQSCLMLLATDMEVSTEGFVVLAFGKLGGEELNYSSDIDLVFLADTNATRFWPLGQKLIKSLMEPTGEGFMYRVDMRLRPWGRSGALVNTVEAHVGYLRRSGMQWEKQALLKARVIAGDRAVGQGFLERIDAIIFDEYPIEALRESVRTTKEKIEAELTKSGRDWGHVKSGTGSIRDVEFVTQFLQLAHGKQQPVVRSINTLDGLVRLADCGVLRAEEYRRLADGYVFLRTIEHSLQLMHYKQINALPQDSRELAYLARRLDFQDAETFLSHYSRHCESIRAIYDKYIGGQDRTGGDQPNVAEDPLADHLRRMEPSYVSTFSEVEIADHAKLVAQLSPQNIVAVKAQDQENGLTRVTIVGFDRLGDLSIICGLLFVYGFDIVSGDVFTNEQMTPVGRDGKQGGDSARKFINVFSVRPPLGVVLPEVWPRYRDDLVNLLTLLSEKGSRVAQGLLAKRVAGALRDAPEVTASLYPVEIEIDNELSPRHTVLHIRSEDTTGFLYELANALAMSGVNVQRVTISSYANRVFDTLHVTDSNGAKITDEKRQRELRAAIVIIKHFTHLLPRSPNPESALIHFRELLEQLFRQDNWVEQVSSLEHTDVLDALARVLGVSDFLWEDFLRLQHDNLFPVVTNVAGLVDRKPKDQLAEELTRELADAPDLETQQKCLNAFKDREMFRTDMRHILGHVKEFGEFSSELTDLAEVVVEAACKLCLKPLTERYGNPRLQDGNPSRLAVGALGKCGGRELGYASDIELIFVYEDNGQTDGPERITVTEFYQKLVESFSQMIQARSEGIFQIDLRLRPYGRAGSLAVSFDAFRTYFAQSGPAWPYERQSLVKLRPIAGDPDFGKELLNARDEILYSGIRFDVAAMRAMREKQVRQLVTAGTINAKLSPGGLVDCEYLVQGLQISYGRYNPALPAPNTLDAVGVLKDLGIISPVDH